jgi:hypothetical protein
MERKPKELGQPASLSYISHLYALLWIRSMYERRYGTLLVKTLTDELTKKKGTIQKLI